MMAANPLPALSYPASGGTSPAAVLSLIVQNAPGSLTHLAAGAAAGSSLASNQRQIQLTPEGTTSRAVTLAPAVMNAAGLQPPARQPVTREYGYSSAFLAQLLDQSSLDNLDALALPSARDLLNQTTAGDAIENVKYLPSYAAKPAPPPVAQHFTPPVEPAPRVVKIEPQTATTSAAETAPIVAAPTPILVPAQPIVASRPVPVQETEEEPAPASPYAHAASAYRSSQSRLPSTPAPNDDALESLGATL